MAKLPIVSFSDVIKHRLMIIPRKKNIPRGTLLSILKQAGLSKEEFLELLK